MEHKINTVKEIIYQAAGAISGLLDVTMTIYDETHALDAVDFPDVIMTEVGATGRYYGSFTPDAIGEWQVHIDSATKPGKVVNAITVVASDIETVDGKIVTVDGKVNTIDTKINGLGESSPMIG